MTRLVNAYTVSPDDIQEGDVMIFVVKAMVSYRDPEGKLRYQVYRCPWNGEADDIPQGAKVLNMGSVCRDLFPTLAQVGEPGY